jgi:hypothetical protein
MDSEGRAYTVHLGDELTEQLDLVPLSTGLYRAEESSLLHESITLGTVIAAETISDTDIRFLSVFQNSPYITKTWLISEDVMESARLVQFLEEASRAGVRWERALGGLLLLHLPPGSLFDADREFKRVTGQLGT